MHFRVLTFSTKPITVRGLTTPEEADDKGTSLSISKVVNGVEIAYWDHDPDWEVKETRFPTQDLRAYPLASTTVPDPSIPQRVGSGLLKYYPAKKILSDGLIVDPSTLIRSSPSLRAGIG